MAEENKSEKPGMPECAGLDEPAIEPSAERQQRSGWEIFRQAFDRARREQRAVSKSDKGRDRSRSLFLLAGGAIAVMLLFLVVFSSPNAARKAQITRRTTPDLGRRAAPGGAATEGRESVTPLLDAQTAPSASLEAQDITPEDVKQTARPFEPAPVTNPANSAPERSEGQYALGRINFSTPPSRHKASESSSASARSALDELKKPSLIFVRNAQSDPASSHPGIAAPPIEDDTATLSLPAGTRLVARLQSAVTTAVDTPVVAAIEYNYEQDRKIVVPAGAMATGSLMQANRSGDVAIHFDSLEFPDGTSSKIDAVAMSLSYAPLQGHVSGNKKGRNFLVRAFTGLGEAATYLVGSSGLSAPLSESSLLRDRLATNIGRAGDQEVNSLTFDQNIVVSVPASTRFYIVIRKEAQGNRTEMRRAAAGRNGHPPLPTIDELRQLLQLRRELSEIYQQPSASQPGPQP